MRARTPDVARFPQVEGPHALRHQALDPRTERVFGAEGLGFLLGSARLHHVMLRTCLHKEDSWLDLRFRTLDARCAWRTVLLPKPDLEIARVRITMGEPGIAFLAHRTGRDFTFPVKKEVRFGKALPGAGLPTGIIGDAANDPHLMRCLTGAQIVGIGIATIDQMLSREQPFCGECVVNGGYSSPTQVVSRPPTWTKAVCAAWMSLRRQASQPRAGGFSPHTFRISRFCADRAPSPPAPLPRERGVDRVLVRNTPPLPLGEGAGG